MRRERMILIFDRKVLLVVPHYGDQNFFRQSQILGLEVAEQHGWPLGEVGHLLHQGLVFSPSSLRKITGCGVECLADAKPARGDIGHDKGCFESREIAGRPWDEERLVPIEDAMAIIWLKLLIDCSPE